MSGRGEAYWGDGGGGGGGGGGCCGSCGEGGCHHCGFKSSVLLVARDSPAS